MLWRWIVHGKVITHACEMSFKHLLYFHDLLHGRFFHTFKPALEVLLCIGPCSAFEDRLELLSQPPGDADLQVGFLDDFEDFILLLRPILSVFQERIATVFEFLMLLRLSAANLINPFVEVLDQM